MTRGRMAGRRSRRESGPPHVVPNHTGQVMPPPRAGRWLGGAGSGPRDRPGGLPPRGSRYGLLGLVGVGMVTAMMGGLALYALCGELPLPDPWLLGLFLGWVALLLGSFIGLTYRRFWGICLGWGQGVVVAAVYPVALAASILVPLGLVVVDAERQFLAWYALVWLGAVAPLWWCLVRMLRLRFWQPWRQRDEWEKGDEPIPRWAMVGLDMTRPWLADEIRRTEDIPPARYRWRGIAAAVFAILVLLRVLLLVLG